jgi:hypothetical protein
LLGSAIVGEIPSKTQAGEKALPRERSLALFAAVHESVVDAVDGSSHPIIYLYNNHGELTDATQFSQALEAKWRAAVQGTRGLALPQCLPN